MPRQPAALANAHDDPCAIVRSLGVLTDTWTFLIVREATLGTRTFAQFRARLDIASDVLAVRLGALVAHGVLRKTPYREAGQRTRDAYELTPAGEAMRTILVALQDWGREHLPREGGPGVGAFGPDGDQRVHAELVDENGVRCAPADVRFVRAAG